MSLSGYAVATSDRTSIYTLPAGWRPMAIVSETTGDSDGKRRLMVSANGIINVEGGTAYYGGLTFVATG
jgi:hypothetical protein